MVLFVCLARMKLACWTEIIVTIHLEQQRCLNYEKTHDEQNAVKLSTQARNFENAIIAATRVCQTIGTFANMHHE